MGKQNESTYITVDSPTSQHTSSEREKKLAVSNNDDQALEYAMEAEGMIIDDETNKRILCKIDKYLLPIMCSLYAIQYMDKVSNSYASIMGIKTDLNMIGDQYSWTGTVFYLGYLAFVFPMSNTLQRFPVAKTVALFIGCWGIIMTCQAASQNYASYLAMRLLLGIFESGITPAFVILTSQWYKREEQFLRSALWFSANGLGVLIGTSIAYGFALHQGSLSIKGWRALFIVIGGMTMLFSVIFYFYVPDLPSKAWFLTEEEKLLVVQRIRTNQQGFGNKKFKLYQLKEALEDPRTWCYFIYGITSEIPNGGITNFNSILISQDLKYGVLKAFLMNLPTGAVQILLNPLAAYFARYVRSRIIVALAITFLVIVGCGMLAYAHEPGVKLAAIYIFGMQPVGMVCLLSCIASNTAGHTKKVVVNAIFLIGYCVGMAVGPQTFIASQSPTYIGAKTAMLSSNCISVLALVLILFLNIHANRKRDASATTSESSENTEFRDLTDFENPNFRYAL
ncbi:hypothetical protein OGAPHI_000869 [Ogataea philodendri]|uniref:Major facilitator superfamily (MFS) profile domain-containing protein n=1 Tax=Ogataea philodendri TaxID=1378263 RepID=A0A9P8PF59_9ASCO|nr:uncharacterized protein OGAPHI_000869 [Ogataea philodendri]KAH3671158.1 hypothetical protein OGAPHI_000869 [Ogataea philodendri]